MGYYQGDYYAGAMGDPFWGGLINVARRGIGALVGVARGRGAPAAAGAATSGIAKYTGPAVAAGRAIMQRGTAAIIKHPVLSAAGAAGVVGAAVGAGGEALAMRMGGGGCAPKGFHMSKPKGGRCPSAPHLVRNRRMNVANGRALSRAVRRLHHFARKYRKVVGFVSPRKPKGRMYFHKKHAKR
jgi:hypothetical protein